MTNAYQGTADRHADAPQNVAALDIETDDGCDSNDSALAFTAMAGRFNASTSAAQEELFRMLYRELHHVARRQIARRRGSAMTLGVTTLLHEAYLRVAAQGELRFASPGHFIAYAARAMRGLIVDHARRCSSQKRGGEFDRITLDTQTAETLTAPQDILHIDEHLDELQSIAPDLAHLVELKFFCGLSFREIAQMRGCSERTIHRDWEKARALLGAMMRGDVGAA